MISDRMSVFLSAELENTADSGEQPILAVAHSSLVQMPDEILFDLWNRHGITGPHNRQEFEAELDNLIRKLGNGGELEAITK